MLKLIIIVILWVYYTIPFSFSLFGDIWASLFNLNFLNYFVWLRITDEGSVPELRIWSILLIKSDIKWCIHLIRTLFLYLVIKNSSEVIKKLRLRNDQGSQVSSFAFSTLYTSLPHHLKAKVLSFINWCFNRESKNTSVLQTKEAF